MEVILSSLGGLSENAKKWVREADLAASVHSDLCYSRLHPDLFTSPPDLRWWLPGSRRCARADINYKLALKDNMVLHGGVLVAITYISSP